jgi:hypothetical protein
MFSFKRKVTAETPFSRFIREASSKEKKQVYARVIKKATEDQKRVLEQVSSK